MPHKNHMLEQAGVAQEVVALLEGAVALGEGKEAEILAELALRQSRALSHRLSHVYKMIMEHYTHEEIARFDEQLKQIAPLDRLPRSVVAAGWEEIMGGLGEDLLSSRPSP